MTKLHDFLTKYLKPSNIQMELEDGKWVNAQPIEMKPPALLSRIKDAWLVIRNKAEAVEKF